jgi:hypothetical protein
MNKLLLSSMVVLMSLSAYSQESGSSKLVPAETSESLQILNSVSDVHAAYSASAGVYAKVISLLEGDGTNPMRMAISLNTGEGEGSSKVYILDYIMMSSVRRIAFLTRDSIVVNYDQDSFDNSDDLNPIIIKKSVLITLQRDKNGKLTNEVLVGDITKSQK